MWPTMRECGVASGIFNLSSMSTASRQTFSSLKHRLMVVKLFQTEGGWRRAIARCEARSEPCWGYPRSAATAVATGGSAEGRVCGGVKAAIRARRVLHFRTGCADWVSAGCLGGQTTYVELYAMEVAKPEI